MGKKSIVTGALILTAAGIITRLLGFVYRIYMSKVMGAEGMGLYQLIMPVYTLGWSIACAGFNTTVSKLTAQERAKAEHGNMVRILKYSVIITSGLGIAVGVALYFGAGAIAEFFFKDARTILSLQILSLSFPLMAAGTCLRGYFLGLQETVVPAVNQVLEQCVRMIVIYFLAGFLIPMGLEYACAAAVIGIVCEEACSFVYIFLAYKKHKRKNKFTKKPSISPGAALSLIFGMALPLTGNRFTGSLLSTLENVLIPQRLQIFGMTAKESMAAYGQVTGMAMPLIYFPTALLTALSVTLVPAVSELVAVKNFARINHTVSKSVLFASITGVGASCMFVLFADELGRVIYNQDIGHMLLLLGVMCPFLYMQVIFSGVLNGLGMQVFIFRNSILSSVINILFIYFVVPVKGVDAFIIGWFASLIIICLMEIEKIRKSIDLEMRFVEWFAKPILSAAGAGIVAKVLADRVLFAYFNEVYALIVAVVAFFMMYLAMIVLTGCLKSEDLQQFVRGIKPQRG